MLRYYEGMFVYTHARDLSSAVKNRWRVQDAANGLIQTKNRLEEALHLDG